MSPILVNDMVVVFFNGLGFDGCSSIVGRVIHAPCDTGDSWFIEEKKTKIIHCINPLGASLEEIVKKEVDDV